MKIYKCLECGKEYFETDLVKIKVSENQVESYIFEYYPKCFNKRKPKMIKLKIEYKEHNSEAN